MTMPERELADEIGKVWALPQGAIRFGAIGEAARPRWALGEVMTILATAGRRPIRIAVPLEPLALRVERLEAGVDLGPRLQADQRGEALEYLFAPVLDELETAVGCRIELLEARFDAPRSNERSNLTLEATLEWDGDALPALVDLPADLLPPVRRFLRNLEPAPPRFPQADIPVCVRLAVQHLSFAALLALKPGDGILLPPPAARRPYLVVAEHRLAAVKVGEGGTILSEAPRGPHDERESAYLQEHVLTNEETTAPDRGPLAGVSVNLAFELGRKRLTIAEVERLSAGDRFPLSRTPDDGVDLVFGGRIIGSGRFIKVDGDLVVEIVEMSR